ncbi:tetratricopeptide repeat protein [Salegentibacter salegens]|uniref:Tetratricopeptide repeat-containing protein n=1 Tax=Salegentibacter salegens TaxID=143223 RepID=A0A1M7NCB6_9FLAO|nr:tetratricopeptide repeat protein [Salegentibacter salegens]PRX42956.1 tetratricopeptide repeat protein [Salegentibacter salegens]SHN01306.1 Tetratricopeptide repeat-containing protein [Salegentibacter salegens]
MLAFKAEAQTSALAISDSLYAVGEYSEAIEKLQKINSKTEKTYLKLAKNYAANRQPEIALENYKKVLDQSPDRVLTAVDYGELLVKTEKLEAADSLFKVLNKKYPKNASFKYQQGLIREKLKDSTAIHFFTYTTMLDTTHQAALYKVAKDKLRNRQYTMAEHYSKRGLRVNPNNLSLLSILAQTYSSLKLYKEALQPYEKLIELGQDSEFIYNKLGFAYYRLKDYDKAIINYNKALEFEDRNSATHYTLGKLYALTGDLDKSETHLLMSILIKKQPVDAEFFSLGLTYKMQEKHKNALEYFNKALEENPDHERALYERAVAADNYMADDETVIGYYQAYFDKYESIGNDGMLYRAKTRISDLKEKIHLAEN